MSKTYTLTEVAEALEADAKTLREWIKRENWDLDDKGPGHPNGLGQTSKYDKRIKWLTDEQVATLAKAHQRLWPPRPKSAAQAEAQATGITGAVSLLREHVDALREDHVGVAQWQETTGDVYKQLGELWEIIKRQGDELRELREWKASQESKGKPGRKPRSAAQDTPEYQAGLAAVEQGDD